MISSEHRWLCQIVLEIAGQLHSAFDKYGKTNIIEGSAAHVALSSTVLCAALRLGNAADIAQGNFLSVPANDNRKGVSNG
jgi:hypothetical protein